MPSPLDAIDFSHLFDRLGGTGAGTSPVSSKTLADAVLAEGADSYLGDLTAATREAELVELIEQGWESLWKFVFGDSFVDQLAEHHRLAIEWHFNARLALTQGKSPDYYAYFPIWSRGHAKSSIAERMIVIDALLTVAAREQGFTLYIGREKERVREHISNIETLLGLPSVRYLAADLARVRSSTDTKYKRQWTSRYLHTAAGYAIKGGSIASAQAGARVDKTRPTFMVLDDIDGREDSEVISEKKFTLLVNELLPMRQSNTLTFFAQNLISDKSVMYRIHTQQARVLTNRKPAVIIPAIRNLKTETKAIDGIVKDIIVDGEPTWPQVYTIERAQADIEAMGLPAFLKECQHEISSEYSYRIHKTYDDSIHAISAAEFADVFGSPDAWLTWPKIPFNDWARTKSKFHANVAGYIAISPPLTKLPSTLFIIPKSFPPDTTPDDLAVGLLSLLTPYADFTEQQPKLTWRALFHQAAFRDPGGLDNLSFSEQARITRELNSPAIRRYVTPALKYFNVSRGAMSHSEDHIRKILISYGFNFSPANPRRLEGVDAINDYFKIDYAADNPFRPGEKGLSRMYVICPTDPHTGRPGVLLTSMTPDLLEDSDLFRYQFANRQFAPPKLTNSGEMLDEPLKLNDDFPQALQMVFSKNLVHSLRTPQAELRELLLPARIRQSNISSPRSAATRQTTQPAATAVSRASNSIDYDTRDEHETANIIRDRQVYLAMQSAIQHNAVESKKKNRTRGVFNSKGRKM